MFTRDDDMLICDHNMFTCDDVLYCAVLPFVNMTAVFSLSSSQFSEKLLLLPFPPVGRRLGGAGGGGEL